MSERSLLRQLCDVVASIEDPRERMWELEAIRDELFRVSPQRQRLVR